MNYTLANVPATICKAMNIPLRKVLSDIQITPSLRMCILEKTLLLLMGTWPL